MRKWLYLTKKQFENGWIEYRPGQIPNIVKHPYVLVRSDGVNYIVLEPKK